MPSSANFRPVSTSTAMNHHEPIPSVAGQPYLVSLQDVHAHIHTLMESHQKSEAPHGFTSQDIHDPRVLRTLGLNQNPEEQLRPLGDLTHRPLPTNDNYNRGLFLMH